MRSTLVALALFSSVSLHAEVKVPRIFSDHMVLQNCEKVPVWGTAAPGEKVSVSVAGKSGEATAGPDGKWRLDLNLAGSGAGPFQMTVQGSNTLTINDVLIGEVWIASGQSNMAWELSDTVNAPAEIAASSNPMFREFRVATNPVANPLADVTGEWRVAGPETTPRFTAASYYFGKTLQKELKVPVGMLVTAVGGTPVEGWISEKAIAENPDLQKQKARMLQSFNSFASTVKAYAQAYSDWAAKFGRTDKPAAPPADFAGPNVSTDGWKPVTIPGDFAKQGLPDSGAIWLRRKVSIDESRSNQVLRVDVGLIRDFDSVYWNGTKFGETLAQSPGAGTVRTYHIPNQPVGEDVLTLRVFNSSGNAGITGDLNSLRVGSKPSNLIYLTGEWLAKAEYSLPPLTPEAIAAQPPLPGKPPRAQDMPAFLNNGMVQPIIPYAFQGVIWYQGESNSDFAEQYRAFFPLLIADWRQAWGRGDFPFIFCQLAGYQPKKPQPSDSAWAELREAQAHTLATVPNTAEAVLIDIGEEGDIHPRLKRPVGERLAAAALAKVYGRAIPFSGPIFKSADIVGNSIKITFDHTDGGLKAAPLPATYQPRSTDPKTVPLVRNSPQSELEGFSIRDQHGAWAWADARIDGDAVVVSAPNVVAPTAVRYAWADTPTCNLVNGAGFPASPFRTDDQPLITKGKKRGFQ